MTTKPSPARPGTSITDELRADVLSAKLAPGSRLVELQLAEQYGVSRASVRSAIAELEKEGLVDREANRGATVRRVTIDEAVQITEARRLLEGLVASRAAAVATDEDRAELLEIARQMHAAVAGERFAEYSTLNGVLHRRLREISRHAVALELIDNLRNRLAHHAFRLALVPGRPTESLAQHQAIIDAVVAGDEQGAERAMQEHLDSVITVLRRFEGLAG